VSDSGLPFPEPRQPDPLALLADWARDARQAMQFVRRGYEVLSGLADTLPRGAEPEALVGILSDLFLTLGAPGDGELIEQQCRQVATGFVNYEESWKSGVRYLLTSLQRALVEALNRCPADSLDPARLIFTPDAFGGGVVLFNGFALGSPDQLPQKHPGRELIPAADLYQKGGRGYLALGPEDSKLWVGADVARHTRRWRNQQFQQEQERADEERREREAAQRRWKATTPGLKEQVEAHEAIIARLRKEVAALTGEKEAVAP
jgi:hypothetical protein